MSLTFIGAGPGAPDLLTLRAVQVLKSADVVMYAGSLVPQEVLAHCKPGAELIDSRSLTLDEITERLIAADRAGHEIARLHSGDPSIYSAVAEQRRRLEQAGVECRVVPGVPAFAAAAAELGVELTVPQVAQSVVLTRISRRSSAMPEGETLANFGATGATLAIHLAASDIESVVAELVPHYGDDCPAAVCAYVSQSRETIIRGTLATIAEQLRETGITMTAVIFVGRALAASGFTTSHLYSAERCRTP